MNTYVWLAFDFVNQTNTNFYAWLESKEALECGNNLAFLRYNCRNIESICRELLDDLRRTVSFEDGDRLYCIARNQNGAYVGRFIIGGRQSNPWKGYGVYDVK